MRTITYNDEAAPRGRSNHVLGTILLYLSDARITSLEPWKNKD
jgi:hypothetical protein